MMIKIIKIKSMWCPACMIMDKHYKKIEKDFSDISFETLDLDMDSKEVEQYEVGNILPVMIKIVEGKEIGRLVGERTEEELISFIRSEE